MSVKLYYKNEIRRFPLGLAADGNGVVTYFCLMRKVRSLYENLGDKMANASLCWKDAEDDLITIASDDDLNEALRNRSDEVLRVYLFDGSDTEMVVPSMCETVIAGECEDTPMKNVTESAKEPSQEQPQAAPEPPPQAPPVDESLHAHVVCDGCNGEVKGHRFKCVVCPDYDLCADCESKNSHDQHPMLRISSPKDVSWKRFFIYARTAQNLGGHCPHLHNHGLNEMVNELRNCVINGTTAATTHTDAALAQVGATISNLLQNFGIEVDYTVEPRKPEEPAKKNDENKPNEAPAQATAAASAVFGEAQQEKKPENPATVNNEEKKKADVFVSEGPQDWEMLESIMGDHRDFAGQVPACLYPSVSTADASRLDVEVNQSLQHMLAMGFTNEGGWLSNLLLQKKGNISAVLDVLQPSKSFPRQ